ncbi:Tryptophan--tRNA ligase [Nosema granulosis]|uniref:tryptophan--tRNA ligase n=1 Tax=Nosema granulosis TaxID=83296 RepID=A0A9P6GYV2_9MICR|nr:Tryptophan--tRNA ligase [Nosema granulosis]
MDQENNPQPNNNQMVTPWEAHSNSEDKTKGIDYKQVISQFGCSEYSEKFTTAIEELSGEKAHRYFRRGIVFAHRDFDKFLEKVRNKQPIYLYTGRGPSSHSMHLGHTVPFLLCRYFQKAFKMPLVIQITDDEKFLWKNMKIEESIKLGKENIKDIIAFGFDPELTYIFSNTEKSYLFQKNILKIDKSISLREAMKVFGFTPESNIGQVEFPSKQIAPCFPSSFSFLKKDAFVLVPAGLDQDPYFRLARDKCRALKEQKPASIYVSLLPDLRGINMKMSASDSNSSIYLTDTPKQISKKINKYAFSGGRETLEEHKIHGGDTEVDVAYQYLRYFFESDEELSILKEGYEKGEVSTGEMKKKCIEVVCEFVKEYQERRNLITDEFVEKFTNEIRNVYE